MESIIVKVHFHIEKGMDPYMSFALLTTFVKHFKSIPFRTSMKLVLQVLCILLHLVFYMDACIYLL